MEQPAKGNDTIEIEGQRPAWRSVGEGPPLVPIASFLRA
jgi:hypothetical protein